MAQELLMNESVSAMWGTRDRLVTRVCPMPPTKLPFSTTTAGNILLGRIKGAEWFVEGDVLSSIRRSHAAKVSKELCSLWETPRGGRRVMENQSFRAIGYFGHCLMIV